MPYSMVIQFICLCEWRYSCGENKLLCSSQCWSCANTISVMCADVQLNSFVPLCQWYGPWVRNKISLLYYYYCAFPSNIPFVIQRDVRVCEQSDRWHDSLQTYIAPVGCCFLWRIRTPNAFVRRHSNSDSTSNCYVTCFWLHAQVIGVFCCISEYNRKKLLT